MYSAHVCKICVISRFSSASNSRILLLASTTSPGSTYTVLPDADSSCTIPPNLRLYEGDIGITSPSRKVGVMSESKYPSFLAL